jgi:hypothetical protein
VWWQPSKGDPYRRFTADDAAELTAEFTRHARTQFLPR